MTDDLISREAAIESIDKKIEAICEGNELTDYQEETASMCREWFVDEMAHVPSIPAVPLDKLCEWLANSFSDPPCCTLENVRCKMECRGFTQMDYSECWRHVLTKWMEGLDGTD